MKLKFFFDVFRIIQKVQRIERISLQERNRGVQTGMLSHCIEVSNCILVMNVSVVLRLCVVWLSDYSFEVRDYSREDFQKHFITFFFYQQYVMV